MTISRGDVVVVDVPFTDQPGSKLRPMLVVQNDHNNARMANTILAVVTTNTARRQEPTQVVIDPATPDGKQSGLFALSVVSCENLLTARR
jgi:mRNA interferase MazF